LVSRFEDEDREAFEAARQAADGSPDKPLLGEYGTLSYLNDRCRLAYLPSLSALVSLRSYPKPAEPPRLDLVSFADPRFSVESSESQSGYSAATRHSLAVLARGIGDLHARLSPLPDTADEARAIAVLVGGTQRVFLRDEAREDRLKALSAQGDLKGLRYLHFATHGLLGGDYRAETRFSPPAATRTAAEGAALRPQPALALSLVGNLEGEDGFLTMREVIEELDMDLDLALLSACNTAGERVEQGRGEGFLGLTRAFLYSGAREVLVSHWSVDSAATRALMTTLFENLSMGSEAESADTAQALADAREALSMTQTVPTGANGLHVSRGHPYFWAPFVVVGAQR